MVRVYVSDMDSQQAASFICQAWKESYSNAISIAPTQTVVQGQCGLYETIDETALSQKATQVPGTSPGITP